MINQYLKYARDPNYPMLVVPAIYCKDGFIISVQASGGHYCLPREDGAEAYTHVECGFPSAVPEFILEYAEEKDQPTDTVYPYVPVELVEQLIHLHGGIAE